MPEIHYVTAQINLNQVCEGFYVVEGSVLTMVDPDGVPVDLGDGLFIRRNLREGDNEIAIAKMLTKQIRERLRAAKYPGPIVEGFGDDINYPKTGVA